MTTRSAEPKLDGVAISDTAIRQPVFITMMVLLAIVAGLLAYSSLPVNYLPDFSVATVSVSVSYPGAGPDTMASQVAKPIEDALTTINGIDHITTNATEGSVQVTAQFVDGVDPNLALQNVREKVNAIVPRLPNGINTPVFRQFDPNDQSVLQLAVTTDGSLSPLQLRTLIDDSVVPQVESVQGVGSIDVNGGQQRQINVYLNLDQIQARHLAPSQVSNAIGNSNTNIGLGTIQSGDQSITLRAPSQIVQPSDIAALPIAGTRYVVGDVATVEDGVAEPTSYARLNGQPAVTLGVHKQSGTNTVSVAEGARQELAKLFAANPHIKYIITNDQSAQVRSAVDSSIEEIVLAVMAAMLVMLLFFRNLRNTLVTVAGLPVIMIFTFAALKLFGVTINIFSLLALSLSVGLVIDDAIVVRENIFRFMERGDPPMVASSRGTAQVALSVLAMTLTIIAVFLPTTLVSGTTGIFFKAFGVTVACAMAISLVEAFTFAPMLSAHLFGQKEATVHVPPVAAGASPAQGGDHQAPIAAHPTSDADVPYEAVEELGWLSRNYERVLAWSLRHRWAPVALTLVILVLSVVMVAGVRISFLPAQASDNFGFGFTMPPGTALDATDRMARQAEQIIMTDPDVAAVQTTVGNGGDENSSFIVRLKNINQTNAVRLRLRPKLTFLPGLVLSTQSFQGGNNTGVTSRNVQLQIQSTRPFSELAPIASRIQQVAQSIQGFTDIGSSYSEGRPEVQFHLRNSVAGDLSLTNNDISSSIRALVSGNTATTWQQNGDDINVVVRLPPDQRADINTINAISVPVGGRTVPLDTLATIEQGVGPVSIRRYDRQNQIVIGANVVAGYDQNQLQPELLGKVQQLGLPADITLSFGGQTQNQQQGFTALFGAMGLSVLLVYIVLASQFGSYAQPLVIMLAMPFSFLGAFVALRLAGKPLDITGMIGLIMLLGLVVKNSILMVDFTNQLRRAGLDKHTALERAGAIRLRPILMTSTAIVAGALPVALGIHFFSSSQGSEFRQALAIVLIGGMITSTLLTLLVVPTAYSLLDSLLQRVSRLLRRRPRRQVQPALAAAGAASGADPVGIYEANGHGADAREQPATENRPAR
ncbi:MAG TPA: efflux RND transporter permease subunit [Roseiflexaceae bacterium]